MLTAWMPSPLLLPPDRLGRPRVSLQDPPVCPSPQDPTGLTWYSTKGELEGKNEWVSETCGCRS